MVDDEFEISSEQNEESEKIQTTDENENTVDEYYDKSESEIGKQLVEDGKQSEIGIPDLENPIHGWEDSSNIGEALLRNRKASYIPTQDWEVRTGEELIQGWNVLAHSYPLPTEWMSDLAEIGVECVSFFYPQGLHCNVPNIAPNILLEYGVIGAFKLDSTDKFDLETVAIMKGEKQASAIKNGDLYVVNIVFSGSFDAHLSSLENDLFQNIEFFSGRFATVETDIFGFEWLSNQEYIEWMDLELPITFENDVGADIVNADWVRDSANMGGPLNTLTGSGVIVGVMDSGLDNAVVCSDLADCNTKNSGIMSDFQGRIVGVENFVQCGNSDGPEDPDGHGTHVAGTVLADGSSSTGSAEYSGIAPEAMIYMQSVHSVCGSDPDDELATPSDFSTIFQPAYDAGARVHTNSWGANYQNNGYHTYALRIDTQAHNLDDLTILYAMGNDGLDSNADGEVDTGYMNTHATAKNIISVGGSENYREGSNIITWDDFKFKSGALKFTEPPIYGDSVVDDIDGVMAISNRGPTSDGRIKPDILAPGSFVASTLSSEASCDWGVPQNPSYCYMTGTSMATPMVAGGAALILEYLNNQGIANPASALVKAMLIAGAHDMEGQYSSGGSDSENSAAESAPNVHEGWGRMDLQGSIQTGFTEGINISTYESHSLKMEVPVGISDFRIVLSWNDPPNTPSAQKQLVNDLDIALRDPTGVWYDYDNDDVNNLVGISVSAPDPGDWEVIINGTNVPNGPQEYYLASSNGLAIGDSRNPVSGILNSAGFQSGSLFTETTLSAGENHFCAIFDDSSLHCRGDNNYGQLGDGTSTNRLTMTEVALDNGRTAVSVSSGNHHTCAILDDASLHCWGRNNKGQLGFAGSSSSTMPTEVNFGSLYPVQISSGKSHNCVILNDASLQCWGDNSYGQLGDGGIVDRYTPATVNFGSKNVLAVSAGSNHTCALLDDQSLECWGSNEFGQLGDGTTDDEYFPSTVVLGGSSVAVSSGDGHTCSLLSDKTLKCWGDNSYGQLGDGTQVSKWSPEVIESDVVNIDSGNNHNCLIDINQVLKCWGKNNMGQVGDGTTSMAFSPTEISLGPVINPLSVTSGSTISCAVTSNDLLKCWGEIGENSVPVSSPITVDLPRWTYINSAERDLDGDDELNIFDTHGAGDSDGDGFAGGDDYDDNNPTKAKFCPVPTYGRYVCLPATKGFYVDTPGTSVKSPARVGHYVANDGASSDSPCPPGTYQSLTGQTSCDDARAGYYVENPQSEFDTPCPGGTFNTETGSTSVSDCRGSDPGYNVPILTEITLGSFHSCSILDDGSVSCWGSNEFGQLGDGTRESKHIPTKVLLPQGKRVDGLSSGSYHNCAIIDDDTFRCWGSNEFGQLGDGTSIERTSPVIVSLGGGKTATSVSSGEGHTCSILNDKTIKCWGDNSNGQLGDGTRTGSHSPIAVNLGGSDLAISISSGSYHTCALTTTRDVKCWGDNYHGQLGLGDNVDRLVPNLVTLPADTDVISISSGSFHTCAVLNNGEVYCWGFNAYGQLGDSSTNNSNIPVKSRLLENQISTQVSSGVFHTCSLLDGGEIACWGDNTVGQLGDGTSTSSTIPIIADLPVDSAALSISVGQRHSCSILDDATLYCWGYNEFGQLGDGTTDNSDSPKNIDLMHGSAAQIQCSPGTYQPDSSQTSCILADRGYSAPSGGALDQIGCTRGYYSSLRGQATCSEASIGYYVDELLATSQTACPSNTSTINRASGNIDFCIEDFDGDLIPDVSDLDDDNDGVSDRFDLWPLDPELALDADGDAIADSVDVDDDNDGVNDTEDLFPNNQNEWADEDNDGIGDNSDDDDDNDGRVDSFDKFPNNPLEWSDFDDDGIGDNEDDNDDNDQFLDSVDAFPNDATEWLDTDSDSIGNNADDDDDGDGFTDDIDVFPLLSTEWLDTDGDSFGDNIDMFDEGGLVIDGITYRLAENDVNWWIDSDGDEIGDISQIDLEKGIIVGDQCPDIPGINYTEPQLNHGIVAKGWLLGCPKEIEEIEEVEEEVEESGLEAALIKDTDGDGQPDAYDLDDDGDGITDCVITDRDCIPDDKYPLDATRPFDNNSWSMILVSFGFISLVVYRLVGWQRRKIAKLKSKRIRLD